MFDPAFIESLAAALIGFWSGWLFRRSLYEGADDGE